MSRSDEVYVDEPNPKQMVLGMFCALFGTLCFVWSKGMFYPFPPNIYHTPFVFFALGALSMTLFFPGLIFGWLGFCLFMGDDGLPAYLYKWGFPKWLYGFLFLVGIFGGIGLVYYIVSS